MASRKVTFAILAVVIVALLGVAAWFVLENQSLTTSLTSTQAQLQAALAAPAVTGMSVSIDLNTDQTGDAEDFDFSNAVTADGNFTTQTYTQDLEITNDSSTVAATNLTLKSEDLPSDLDGLDEFNIYVENNIKSYLVKNGEPTAGISLPDLLREDDTYTANITMELDDNVSTEDTLENNHEYQWNLLVYSGTTEIESYEITMQT